MWYGRDHATYRAEIEELSGSSAAERPREPSCNIAGGRDLPHRHRVTVLRDGGSGHGPASGAPRTVAALLFGRPIANSTEAAVRWGDGAVGGGLAAGSPARLSLTGTPGDRGLGGSGAADGDGAGGCGADPMDSGRLALDGREGAPVTEEAIDHASATSPGQKGEGLALQLGLAPNVTLAQVPDPGGGWIWPRSGGQPAWRDDRASARRASQPVRTLSGGKPRRSSGQVAGKRPGLFFRPARTGSTSGPAELFDLIGRLAADGARSSVSSDRPALNFDRSVVLR